MTQSCFVFVSPQRWLLLAGSAEHTFGLIEWNSAGIFHVGKYVNSKKQALGPNSARSAGLSTGSALTERLINERGKCHIQASEAKHFDLPHKIMRFPVTRFSVHTASHTRFTKWVGYCFKRICSVSKRKCTRRWNVRHENTQTSTSLTFVL